MADLMVSMGIEDRGVRRGLQTAEALVHRSQQNMGRRGLFGDDAGILRTEKGLNKIAGTMTGLPMKLGAVGAAFYAFKNGAEYLREFEGYLPKAERGIGAMTDATKRFKDSWALDMMAGAGGAGFGGAEMLDGLSKAREWYTDYVATVMTLMTPDGGAMLGAGDTAWAHREAAKRDMEVLKAHRLNEQSLVRQKQLNADIAGSKEDQRAADIARAEAQRAAASVELGRKARDEGYGSKDTIKAMAEERSAIRARYDAAVEKANREEKARKDEASERQSQEDQRRLEEKNRRQAKAAEDSLRIEDNRVRAMEIGAVTAEEKLAAKEDRIWQETEERLRGYAQRRREGTLDKAGYDALRASDLMLEDAQYKAAEGEYAKTQGDAARAAQQKREGAMIDAEELKAQTAAAKARTEEEKKVAKELELQAKFRRDEAIVRSQGLDPDVERMLLEERRNLLDAELGAAGREKGGRDDYARPGLDLSSAGAVASQGQAFAFSIPGKIDKTNSLLQQANQTLREIKQGQGDGARFAP